MTCFCSSQPLGHDLLITCSSVMPGVTTRCSMTSGASKVSRMIRRTCVTGPVEAIQGRGFLLGLRCRRPARDIQAELLDRDLLVGTSADPRVVRLLPPLTLEARHVATLAGALSELDR